MPEHCVVYTHDAHLVSLDAPLCLAENFQESIQRKQTAMTAGRSQLCPLGKCECRDSREVLAKLANVKRHNK